MWKFIWSIPSFIKLIKRHIKITSNFYQNIHSINFFIILSVKKFREFLLGTSRIARLDAKQEYLRQMLQQGGGESPTSLRGMNTSSSKPPPRRKRIGRLQMSGQPKLFGGSLVEYLETTSQEIPLIVKSCIRVINLYGRNHNMYWYYITLKQLCLSKFTHCGNCALSFCLKLFTLL